MPQHQDDLYAGREFHYTAEDFAKVAALLYQLTGIRLNQSKDSMVYSRLARRIRQLQLAGVAEYLQYVRLHPSEEEHFINALTTNLTSFFRESHHFDLLRQFLQEQPCQRIWCAASSTGEEPYSIAMVVAEHFGSFDTPVEIIATDIDSQVLNTAHTGVYAVERISGISDERRHNFFLRGKGAQSGKVKVHSALQQMVAFRRLNLLDRNWPVPTPVDVIFCRNVMIYFDRNTQLALLERMVRMLKPEGLYIAGHSENFAAAKHLLTSVGRTAYRPVKGG
jgi:chemotaxis protein methyltransferase CheR